jgi:hypothetical protein
MSLTTHKKPEDDMNSNSTRLSARPTVDPAATSAAQRFYRAVRVP